jgi:hypothetical protein
MSSQDKLYTKIVEFREILDFVVDKFKFEIVYMYKYSI